MHDRLGIGLGDDQRVGAVQESADFRRRLAVLGAVAAQHQHVRIGENAQAALFGALQVAGLLAAAVAELAHAEEGEIVVAQPFEEGDRLRHGRLLQRYGSVTIFRYGVVEARQHRLPVGSGGAHLRQHLDEPFLEAGALRPP